MLLHATTAPALAPRLSLRSSRCVQGWRLSWRPQLLRAQRSLTTQTVTDADVSSLAAKPLHPLTLADLVKYGCPPLPASELYNSANFTLSILPQRLAHRIQSLRSLPDAVTSNPHISEIHGNYLHSLSTLLPWSKRTIGSLEDEIKFTELMADLVQTHAATISTLANGFAEVRQHISPGDVTRYLDEHLRARIGTRLIAEQHIALHFSSKPHLETTGHEEHHDEEQHAHSYIGIIDTELRPADIVRHCEHMVSELCEFRYGIRPSLVIKGEPDYTFAHIPVHLEYIITELLKNAFRATVERDDGMDPIEVTITPMDNKTDASHAIANHDQGNVDEVMDGKAARSSDIRPLRHSTPGVMIRISDRGGGISPEDLQHIWNYSFTTFQEEELKTKSSHHGGGSIAGLGYGLPLGRAYAEYFGGGIDVQSHWGTGTNVELCLRGVGKVDWTSGNQTT